MAIRNWQVYMPLPTTTTTILPAWPTRQHPHVASWPLSINFVVGCRWGALLPPCPRTPGPGLKQKPTFEQSRSHFPVPKTKNKRVILHVSTSLPFMTFVASVPQLPTQPWSP